MMEQTYTMSGVKLAFPCKAYPTQLSMMSMIIKGIEKHQNCLLESPTGSGKSLALLCSCLGWQKAEKEKQRKADEDEYQDVNALDDTVCGDDVKQPCQCTCSCRKAKARSLTLADIPSTSSDPPEEPQTSPAAETTVAHVASPDEKGEEKGEGGQQDDKKVNEEEDDDDFQPSKKRSRKPGGPMGAAKKTKRQKGVVFDDAEEEEVSPPGQPTNPHTKSHWEMKLVTPQANAAARELVAEASRVDKSSCFCPCHSSPGKSGKADKEEKGEKEEKEKEDQDGDGKPKQVPRIYFGTRTHKQIAQIIRELGRTAYSKVNMTILGSREHTCVHPTVSKGKNKNEGCKELLDGKHGGSCNYYANVHRMKQQWQIRNLGLTEAWDLEDLVGVGKRIRACPYFASRALKEQADVIFCPYNYLIDPMIREAMEIQLKGQVVVLDEAHNIEDSAREAASLTITTEQLQDTTDELDRLLAAQFRPEHTRVMHSVSSSLLRWINDFAGSLKQSDFDRASRVWTGPEIVGALANMGISPATMGTLSHHFSALIEDEDKERGIEEMGVSLSAASGSLFKGLFTIFTYLMKDNMKFTKDYKVALLKTKAKNPFPDTNGRWLNRRRRENVWTLSLNFWCLNPAVAFTDFGNAVRTIVLTSGTLSPMTSFASELGVNFPIQLEANHVIANSQVWVSTLAMGPSGTSLNASYRNAETFAFQDDLGRVVAEVCRAIPYGVLCFVSSYSMMNKLMERWKATGLLDQLESMKAVMCEARGGDKAVFDEQLRSFYDTIRECEENGLENQPITGVLMFAVCRGKISEGMDFADNNARAVITVGIPFPNVRDSQVELKRQYNDQLAASRGLLTGSEWYEVQAYRALNQALGRCIRHKKDWGAILLIDERFVRNPKKYISGLSKWVRGKVNPHTHFRDALSSLTEFAQGRMQAQPDADVSVMDASQPNSQPMSPMVHGNTSALSHTPFRSNLQVSVPNTPMSAQPASSPSSSSVSKGDEKWRRDSQKKAGGRQSKQSGRKGVGQLFVPVSSNSRESTDRASLQQHTMGHFFTPLQHGGKNPGTPQQGPTRQGTSISRNGFQEEVVVPSMDQNLNDVRQVAPMKQMIIQTPSGPRVLFVPSASASANPQQSRPGQSEEVIDLTGSPVQCDSIKREPGVGRSSTPKTKLAFIDGESSPSIEQPKKPTLASKLSKFLFTKNDQNGGNAGMASDGQMLGGVGKTCVETRTDTSGEGVKKQDNLNESQRTIPTSDEEEEDEMRKEERRRKKREEDNNTPVLFDSEVGDSGSDHCPGKPVCFFGDTVSTKTEKMGVEEARNTDGGGDLGRRCNGTVADGDPKNTSEVEEGVKGEEIFYQQGAELGRKSRLATKGRRSLSRKRESSVQEDAGDDSTSKVPPSENKAHLSVRRSARTRRTPKKTAETGEEHQQSVSCTASVTCLDCGSALVSQRNDVLCVSVNELGSSYLQGQVKVVGRSRHAPSCECLERRSMTHGEAVLLTDASNLMGVSPLTHERSSGLELNTHWSDGDQCCYQPITCSVCSAQRPADASHGRTPPVIGYRVVASGPNSRQETGKVFLNPHEIRCCPSLL